VPEKGKTERKISKLPKLGRWDTKLCNNYNRMNLKE
jgi:hypothetical protein